MRKILIETKKEPKRPSPFFTTLPRNQVNYEECRQQATAKLGLSRAMYKTFASRLPSPTAIQQPKSPNMFVVNNTKARFGHGFP